ncbi:MAG: tRNA uridine-5-carboxymethylaminomethyl(34) synthesis GTPase MnmE [Prevotella sp.]
MNEDTICAIATGQGGAIGVIRISGPKAFDIADAIFTAKGKQKEPLREKATHTLTYGVVHDKRGETIDEVLASVFRAPHSYTGEDAVELACHASPYIMQQVMQQLTGNGCRLAMAGEFTQRAFLNGKMDLSQAEAVADVIGSTTQAAHRMAMNQMKGAFSRQLATLREKLLTLTSLLELEIDFSDHEELEFANRDELRQLAGEVQGVISRLTDSFSTGNALKRGVPVAIVGETNTGKSTLLNVLVGEEKAIVSDIHGTTRDVIEDIVSINGTAFRFIDTAGIRKTTDTIENLGIERTYQKLEQATIVLLLVDATQARKQYQSLAPKIIPLCQDKTLIIVVNKSDLTEQQITNGELLVSDMDCCQGRPNRQGLQAEHIPQEKHIIHISAKTGEGIEFLKQRIVEAACLPELTENDVVVTNIRHYEALTHALEAITRVNEGLDGGLPSDLISLDLRECIHHIATITGGEITTDSVLTTIFSRFCVGK